MERKKSSLLPSLQLPRRSHVPDDLLSPQCHSDRTSCGLDLRGEFERGRVYAYLGYGLSWTRYTASQDNFGTPRLLYEKPYLARLPSYHRLDVSLERTFTGELVDLTAKAGAINLYDRQNLFYFDLFTQRRVNQLPLVPYVALKIEV